MMTNLRRAMKGGIIHVRAVPWAHGCRAAPQLIRCSASLGGGVGSAAEAVLMQRTGSVLLPTLIAAFFLTGCPEKKVEKEEPAAPSAVDKSGVGPLHRAVRTRCAGAVRMLLEHGADPRRKNGSGSTPLHLAVQNTGRGGAGSPASRDEQARAAA